MILFIDFFGGASVPPDFLYLISFTESTVKMDGKVRREKHESDLNPCRHYYIDILSDRLAQSAQPMGHSRAFLYGLLSAEGNRFVSPALGFLYSITAQSG